MSDTSSIFHLGPYTLTLLDRDIREFVGKSPVVSSDDNYLSHGGGVSAAIWEVAGDALDGDQHVRDVQRGGRELTIGDVLLTLGDTETPVLHAITIDFRRGRRAQRDELVRLYSNLLDVAEARSLPDLALPLLAARSAGFTQPESFEVFIEVLLNRVDSPLTLHLVILTDELAGDPAVSESVRETIEARGLTYDPGLPGVPRRSRERLARGLGPQIRSAAEAVDNSTAEQLPSAVLHLWATIEGSERVRGSAPQRLLARARDGRNRLVHSPGAVDLPVVRELLRSCDLILDAAVAATAEPTQPLPLVAPIAHDVPAARDALGTTHVRNLHRLLMEQLDEDQLEQEHDRLRELGYSGDVSNCLLESCVSEHPVNLLLTHFAGRDLRRVLRERDIAAAANDEPEYMSRKLLAYLGFPLPPRIVDPELLLIRVRIIRSEIPALDGHELEGRVTSVARSMETVLRTYLRFMALGLLSTPPDKWYEEKARARGGPETLEKVTMGGLVYLIEKLGREIEDTSDTTIRERLRDFFPAGEGITWIPRKAHDLVSRRNFFVHGDADGDGDNSLSERRRQADEFCDVADVLLEGLNQGAYPTVIEVREVRFDEWGRRRVRGRTSSGKSEDVFTDQELRAGEVYLMYSRTNPLRVDPLLVQAGVEAAG